MFFENDVKESLNAGLEGHLRFYVDTYLYDKNTEKDRADYRAHIINQEQSLLLRSADDSARLKVIEYLDSHPLAKQHAVDYVSALHRAETMPSISSGHAHGGDAGAVLQEQLHRLEGGFLVALVQGIYNEHYHDLAVALDKAGPATTIAGMVEAHGEAMHGGIESARRFEEAEKHREDFIHQAGKESVSRSISETGGKNSAEHWPNTATELGHQKLHELENSLGKATTGDLIDKLHPGQVPGDSAWQEGNARHPELFTSGGEKHEGASNSREGHADGKGADGSSGHIPQGQALEHLAQAVNNPNANLPADKPQQEHHAQSAIPHESGMSVPEHLVPHGTQPTHESGMSVPEHLVPGGTHHTHESGMSVPEHLVPHGTHPTHESGMSVPEHLVPHGTHPTHESGMSVPEHLVPHGTHPTHESGMSVPEHVAPHAAHPAHHAHDTAANTPAHGTAHDAHQSASTHQGHVSHDVGLDGGVH